MSPKQFILLLAIMGICFFGSLGLGIFQADGAIGDLRPGLVEGLGNLLGGPQPVTADDLDKSTPSSCRQQFEQGSFILPAGNSCVLVVGESSRPVRSLQLSLIQGIAAQAAFVQNGDNGLQIEQLLQSNQRNFTIQFLQEGGAVQVICLNSPCRVDLR